MSGYREAIDPRAITLGWRTGFSTVTKFGSNTDVDAATAPEDIWSGGGLYTGFPTGAAETITITSGSDDDTATTGAGCRTLTISGLDANGAEQTETVNMGGTGGTTTTSTWTRVFRAYGASGGASATNVGAITITHTTTTANVFCVIPAGFGQTRQACYTIPAGKQGLLIGGRVSISNNQVNAQECDVAIAIRVNGSSFWRLTDSTIATTSTPSVVLLQSGVAFPALTDITARAVTATSDNLQVDCSFEIVLVPM